MTKLGDCYRMVHKVEEAVACYSIATQKEEFPAYAYQHYAEALMTLGRYKEAKELLLKFQMLHPENRSVVNQINSCTFADSLWKVPPTGILSFESFNTDGYEFGPTFRGTDLVFTTDSVYGTERKNRTNGREAHSTRFALQN